MTRLCPVDTGNVHGPVAVPARSWSGHNFTPQDPGLYGRYFAIDLTANNALCFPGRVVDLGWGVCRQGFGLQHFGDGYMTEAVANARADALNHGEEWT